MKRKPIHTSALDDDAYKYYMQNAVWLHYPNTQASYRLINRGPEKLGYLADRVKDEIDALASLSHTKEEIEYLKSWGYLRPGYLSWLSKSSLCASDVHVENWGGQLRIEVGPCSWLSGMPWECKIMSTITELHFLETLRKKGISLKDVLAAGERRLFQKIDYVRRYPGFTFADFGTRRRAMASWQYRMNDILLDEIGNRPRIPDPFCFEQFVGTSNVWIAHALKTRAIGTMAHEWIMAHLALVARMDQAQREALFKWLQTYHGRLGTALSDTFTTQAFFADFGPVLSREYDGVRHDSGDPYAFGRQLVKHYADKDVNPRTKLCVFSNELTIMSAVDLWLYFVERIKTGFGIGTHMTFDFPYVSPLKIVLKMVMCNGEEVVKLSDDPSKGLGSDSAKRKVCHAFKVDMKRLAPSKA